MKNLLFKLYFIVAMVALILAPGWLALADNSASAQALQAQKTQLEIQLQEVENQIAQFQQEISMVQAQKDTLQRKLRQLNLEQNQLNLQIQATNLSIKNLDSQISQTQSSIDQTQQKIATLKVQVTDVIQQVYNADQAPLVTILISSNNFSDFFDQVNNYENVGSSLSAVVNQLKDAVTNLQNQQQQLTDQQQQQQNQSAILALQNDSLTQTVSQQSNLLQQTKGQESNYQALLSDNQKQAASIRSRIYDLFGTNNQVTFGQAVSIADFVSQQTGASTAFLLAILTQESNLGKNVGTCNRPGDPPEKSYKAIMNPTRDIPPFLQITANLGRDANSTPVSCPMYRRGRRFGWGGAMGPAQFIPSTWMGYKDQVAAITGQPADPWNIKDAFLAAALKLKADGANNTQQGQWDAAMRYFSGSTNPRYRFYGDNVLAITHRYQNDINNLGN